MKSTPDASSERDNQFYYLKRKDDSALTRRVTFTAGATSDHEMTNDLLRRASTSAGHANRSRNYSPRTTPNRPSPPPPSSGKAAIVATNRRRGTAFSDQSDRFESIPQTLSPIQEAPTPALPIIGRTADVQNTSNVDDSMSHSEQMCGCFPHFTLSLPWTRSQSSSKNKLAATKWKWTGFRSMFSGDSSIRRLSTLSNGGKVMTSVSSVSATQVQNSTSSLLESREPNHVDEEPTPLDSQSLVESPMTSPVQSSPIRAFESAESLKLSTSMLEYETPTSGQVVSVPLKVSLHFCVCNCGFRTRFLSLELRMRRMLMKTQRECL